MIKSCELCVVGAGIAGLATAEIAARSGHDVVLIERLPTVCSDASGAHHGWFHFGSLYSIFPNNQFMRTLVGGIDDLLDYYGGFVGLNMRVSDGGNLVFTDDAEGWIRNEPIDYLVSARNDSDFDLRRFDGVRNYAKKLIFTLGWDLTIKQFISRHQRFHRFDWRTGPASQHVPKAGWLDYSREVIQKPKDFGCRIDRDTHFTVQGFDRPMNARAIVRDLLGSFLAHGGALMCGSECLRFTDDSQGCVKIETSNGTIHANRLVIAGGRGVGQLCGEALQVNVVASPLLVAYPAVCDINWARLTPFRERTVNHLRHFAGANAYSLIGGGYVANPHESPDMERAKSEVLRTAHRVFPRLASAHYQSVYMGYKTEVVTKMGERNYQYFVRQIASSTYALVPGKFSLGFSLAVNAYRQIFGRWPSRVLGKPASVNVDAYVMPPFHERMVLDHLRKKHDLPESLARQMS